MTSLGITKDFRRFDQEFAVTNELRTRAVLLLHEVFGHEHKEIAEITGTSAANSRQILARARRHVDKGNPRFEASRARREEVARRFFAAADGGDLDGLLRALAPDVVYYGDGGGEARAVVGPCTAGTGLPASSPGCSAGSGSLRLLPDRSGERAARRSHLRPRWACCEHVRAGHRGWRGAGNPLRGQPGQAAHLGQVSELAREPPPEVR